MMPVVLMLNGIGFVMIYRLNDPVDAPWHYQAIWTVLGVAAYVVTLAVVRRSRDLERYRYLLVFGALALLVLPLAPYLGNTPEYRLTGVRLWIQVGTGHVSTGRDRQAHARDLLRVLFRGEAGDALALDAAGGQPPAARSAPSRADRGRVGRVAARHPLRARHRLLLAALRDVHRDAVGCHRALDLCRRRTHRVRGRHLPGGPPSLCEDLDRPANDRLDQSRGVRQHDRLSADSRPGSRSAGAA